MAIESKWAITEQDATYPQAAWKKEGQHLDTILSKVAIAAADDNASVYGMATLASTAVIKNILVATTAITNGTDYDIGLYRVAADGSIGAVIDKDMFLDGQTMASAKIRGSEVTGMSALSVANSDKTIGELAAAVSGNTEKDGRYALCLTANTVGTVAGTILGIIEVIKA